MVQKYLTQTSEFGLIFLIFLQISVFENREVTDAIMKNEVKLSFEKNDVKLVHFVLFCCRSEFGMVVILKWLT